MERINPSVDDVWNDIKLFLNQEREEVFYNERELQVRLDLYLEKTQKYKKIYLEYYVPVHDNKANVILKDYIWESEIRMDIVVATNDSFIPIELKYKTKKIMNSYISRFGEDIEDVDIIKEQSAQNIGRYDFWKDIKRIEVVKTRFGKVLGDIALFLTNDSSYYKTRNGRPAYYNFRLSDDNDGSNMAWLNAPKIADEHPDFHLNDRYAPKWIDENDTALPDGWRCFYCLIKG